MAAPPRGPHDAPRWRPVATFAGALILLIMLGNVSFVRNLRVRASPSTHRELASTPARLRAALYAQRRFNATHSSSARTRGPVEAAASPPGGGLEAEQPAALPMSVRPGAVAPQPLDLVMNDAARTRLDRGPRGLLFVTFGSASMTEFMHNWMHHVAALHVEEYVLAALDDATFDFCGREGYPSVKLPERQRIQLDGKGEQTYFRMDHLKFLVMGIMKSDLLGAFVRAGYDVLLSDLDIVWLADPQPYLSPPTAPARAVLVSLADIVTASDAVDTQSDSEAGGWLTKQEINTGVLLFRATKPAVAVIDDWRERMVVAVEQKKYELRNDQLFFNDAVKQQGLEAVALAACEAGLRAFGRADMDALEIAAKASRVRGIFRAKRALPYIAPPPLRRPGEPATGARGLARAEQVSFTLSTFSITEFANGHTFFVQRLHEVLALTPFAVHTTHQFADTMAYALGKRQRLREVGKWAVDPPSYYSEGNYLALHGELLREEDVREGMAMYPAHDPRRHIQIDSRQREVLRDALALARATGRTLIMPQLQCWCDRFWNRLKGCRYPTDHSLKMPFRCPMDHLFFIDKWDKAKLPYRESSFLNSSRTPAALLSSRLRLTVVGAPAGASGAPQQAPLAQRKEGELAVAEGTCFSEIAGALGSGQVPRVLDVDVADLRRLCPWLGSADAQREFNSATKSALHHTVRFCTEERLDGGVNCPWGYRPPPALPGTLERARAFARERPSVVVHEHSEPRQCHVKDEQTLEYACA